MAEKFAYRLSSSVSEGIIEIVITGELTKTPSIGFMSKSSTL